MKVTEVGRSLLIDNTEMTADSDRGVKRAD